MAASPEREDTHADETTLSDEEWPVAEHYRVEPEPEANAADDDELARPAAATVHGAAPRRRRPPGTGRGLALAAVAALLVVPAVWLLTGGLDEGATVPPEAGSGSANGGTLPTTPESTTTTPIAGEGAVAVPDVGGMTLAEAGQVLAQEGLRVRIRRTASDRPVDSIVRQSPPAGAMQPESGLVVLTVSSGPASIGVPHVVGLRASAAVEVLRGAGLRSQLRTVSSTEPTGTVVGQDPAADAEVGSASVVRLRVAGARDTPAAPTRVEIPSLVGLSVSSARSRLRVAGLRSRVTEIEDSAPKGEVIDQSPGAGTRADRNGLVTLTVSSGPARVQVPDTLGLDEQAARAELEAAGFSVESVDEATTDPAEDGLVVAQSPAGGTRARAGATVTIRVARFS